MSSLGQDAAATTEHREPDWIVQSVFDPDGGGHDFAYTIGLHERGLPELHVWARPSLGEDPAADWMLSMRDRTRLLNKLAWRLIDGEVGVGSAWEEQYDAGLATGRFRIDPPGDREELEAFGTAPDAVVLPVTWSLHRTPIGKPTSLTTRARLQARRDYDEVVATLRAPYGLPRGWRMPSGEPRFGSQQRYGSLTPLVVARAAQLCQIESAQLEDLVDFATLVDWHGGLSSSSAVATALSRTAGRVQALERLHRDCHELVKALRKRPAWSATWSRATAGWESGDRDTDRRVRANLEGLLLTSVEAILCSEAVSDLMTAEQLMAARGPWQWALTEPVGEIPGMEWAAPPDVLAQLLAILRPLDGPAIGSLVELHLSNTNEHYLRLVGWLLARSVTSPAGCPWRGQLDQLPAILTLTRGVAEHDNLIPAGVDHVEIVVAPIPRLQAWATILCAALTYAEVISDQDVECLRGCYAELLPAFTDAVQRRRADRLTIRGS